MSEVCSWSDPDKHCDLAATRHRDLSPRKTTTRRVTLHQPRYSATQTTRVLRNTVEKWAILAHFTSFSPCSVFSLPVGFSSMATTASARTSSSASTRGSSLKKDQYLSHEGLNQIYAVFIYYIYIQHAWITTVLAD